MINLDFSLAVSIYALIFLSLLLVNWLGEKNGMQNGASLDERFIWYCAICAYTYINTKQEVISNCPRCGSYNKK